jgi:hypothetical protein
MSRQVVGQQKLDSTDVEPERILVHKLVDSSKAQRKKAVERLKTWINARTMNPKNFFTTEDLIKIWKGLYYNMWMADKPILQVDKQIDSFVFYYCVRLLGSTSCTDVIMDS